MTTRIRQFTSIPVGSGVKVSNNFQRKHIHINRIPPGSKIRVDKSFVKPETLKTKMSKIKASPKYKAGETKARNLLASRKMKNGAKIKVNISTS